MHVGSPQRPILSFMRLTQQQRWWRHSPLEDKHRLDSSVLGHAKLVYSRLPQGYVVVALPPPSAKLGEITGLDYMSRGIHDMREFALIQN